MKVRKKVRKRIKEYKSIYANIPKTQKRMAVGVFIGAVLILIIIAYFVPVGTVNEYVKQMCISVASAALFAIIYSLFADYNLIREVAARVSNEFNHSVPITIYPSNDHPENLFKEHLTTELSKCTKYYYEGIDLYTASSCIVRSIHQSEDCTFPIIHLIVTSARYLRIKEGIQLVRSIDIIRNYLNDNSLVHNGNISFEQEIEVVLHILPHKTGFHIHLTDNYLWLSPFRGQKKYPTTYQYQRNESKDSFYFNIRNRLLNCVNDTRIKKIDLCSSDKEFYREIWNKLELTAFMRKYNINSTTITQMSYIDRFMEVVKYENEA